MKCFLALIASFVATATDVDTPAQPELTRYGPLPHAPIGPLGPIGPSGPYGPYATYDDSSIGYVPALALDNKEFVHALLSDPVSKAIADGLGWSERGHLDEAIQSVTKLGVRAAREAVNIAEYNWPVRKNLLNHLRHEAIYVTQRWCRPQESFFCQRKFKDTALDYVNRMYCANFPKEARDETCLPEARIDFNRAKLTRMPPY
eukprot:Blabericola_migrator_1__4103@NODE_224_length_11141_cov_42_071880_g190_i0_p8_GENE_NODE_224_length_11141_cov_42_071880_g190_i0NODE_224_length_11141_cov_42_071880_g190_i0_p8_ORF_typecomplete_len203_score35_39Peptidase_Mx/PF15887_5/0_098_NODE_224_length_11141_cov_42_071880_g190_i034924100